MARILYLAKSKLDEIAAWRAWIRAFGKLRENYFQRCSVDPLIYGEVSTVGLMLAAAGRAGLTGMLEYPTRKRSQVNGDDCHGRCDLWLMAPRNADTWGWAFEVKHARVTSRSSKGRLLQILRAAWWDAGALDVNEASKRIACVVLYSTSEIPVDSKGAKALAVLAARSDWAWRISHPTDLHRAYIFMRQRHRANRFPRS